MPPPKPTHLAPSSLGTKEYWDQTYTHDLTTAAHTPSHTGQDWFSDNDASSKILQHLTSSDLGLDVRTTSFLDLGTGNGEMLFLLREERGFMGKMIGVDYSASSVEFCHKRLEAMKDQEIDTTNMTFSEWDIMKTPPNPEWKKSFDIILDKGTFDAISLSEEVDESGRRICEGYGERVEVLVKNGGWVVVTSCNWTEEELKGWFGGGGLVVGGRVEYPVFRFGGGSGQAISTVCFRKGG